MKGRIKKAKIGKPPPHHDRPSYDLCCKDSVPKTAEAWRWSIFGVVTPKMAVLALNRHFSAKTAIFGVTTPFLALKLIFCCFVNL